LVGKAYDVLLEERFQWSSWAAPKKADGSFDHDTALTGDDLIAFVDGELFPYLRGFKQRATSPNTIEYEIGEIFGEIKSKFQVSQFTPGRNCWFPPLRTHKKSDNRSSPPQAAGNAFSVQFKNSGAGHIFQALSPTEH